MAAHPDYTRERVRQATREAAARVYPETRPCSRLRITGPDGVERDAALGMELGPLWATWWLDVEAERAGGVGGRAGRPPAW